MKKGKRVPLTEEENKNSLDIDKKSTEDMLRIINNEDKIVANAVEGEIPKVARVVNLMVDAIREGGRLLYIGSGTSGRLGVLDAVELPVTFGVDSSIVKAILAGGKDAMFVAKEGAEDSKLEGRNAVINEKVNRNDVVVGITASGNTPYVSGALEQAQMAGSKTVAITCNPSAKLSNLVDVHISPRVGPEVIAGSTRMKSASAQKMILNMISTASMIRLGKVYGNLMVDVKPHNQKLIDRAKRIIAIIGNTDLEEADSYFKKAKGDTKVAIIMLKTHKNYREAKSLLEQANGMVRDAIKLSNSSVES
ncbi:MAG TPA: N-acetylmuramic acid 6-phosphate etherase [Thermoplasmata archaeon]|nr:N-acetylmuramic acid 6-phosphate etherase [Thermoplasmata archaeon]